MFDNPFIKNPFDEAIKDSRVYSPSIINNYDEIGIVMKYAYDQNGNMQKVTTTDMDEKVEYECANYAFSADGLLIAVLFNDGTKAVYDYDDFGRVISESIEYPDGYGTARIINYNDRNKVSEIHSITNTSSGFITSDESKHFIYDAEDRIIIAKMYNNLGKKCTTYTNLYDKNGFIVRQTAVTTTVNN